MGNKFCKNNGNYFVDSSNQPLTCSVNDNTCYIYNYDNIINNIDLNSDFNLSSNIINTGIKCSFHNNGEIYNYDTNLINNYSKRKFIGTPEMETSYYWTYHNINDNYNKFKKNHIENKKLFIQPLIYTSNISIPKNINTSNISIPKNINTSNISIEYSKTYSSNITTSIPKYVYTPIDKEIRSDIFLTLLIVFSVIVIFLLLLFMILLYLRRRQ